MSLDITKLEDVKERGSRIIARCPACAEAGHDSRGNHLSIDEHGRFSCVVYPGDSGIDHRKRIYVLVGNNDGVERAYSMRHDKTIRVKTVNKNTGIVLKKNVLGHLGRVNQTLMYKEKDNKDIYKKNIKKGVPSVPNVETESTICDTTTETEETSVIERTCSKCDSRAIPYVGSSGKYIVDKCNVHGARLKVEHADIDAYSRVKERNNSTESDNQLKVTDI